jgi:hypothetical protein
MEMAKKLAFDWLPQHALLKSLITHWTRGRIVSYSATHKTYICRLQIRPITILHVPQWVLVVQNGSRYPSAIVSVIKEQSNRYKRANIPSVIKKLIFIHLSLSRKKIRHPRGTRYFELEPTYILSIMDSKLYFKSRNIRILRARIHSKMQSSSDGIVCSSRR